MKKETGIRLGHLTIYVKDLDVSVPFFEQHFQLRVTERIGQQFVFMSADHLHHQLALQAYPPEQSAVAIPQQAQCHLGFEVADKATLATTYLKLVKSGVQVYPVDHGISWALYFNDPDGHGLELYVDTREELDGSKLWKGINKPLYEHQILEHLPDEVKVERVLDPVA